MDYTFSHNYCDGFFDLHDGRFNHSRGDVRVDFILNLDKFLQETYSVPRTTAHAIAKTLFARMNDARLHYHTPVHILSMFQWLQQIRKEEDAAVLDLLPEQHLAIWFHDAIYVPGSTSNEADSAAFMTSLMTPFIKDRKVKGQGSELLTTAQLLNGATVMIMCTEIRSHFNPFAMVPEGEIIVDLDVCNFAWKKEAFEEAGRCVAAEFDNSPEEKEKGRKAFFEKLLGKGFIYRTNYFKRFEKTAKDQIQSIIGTTEQTA